MVSGSIGTKPGRLFSDERINRIDDYVHAAGGRRGDQETFVRSFAEYTQAKHTAKVDLRALLDPGCARISANYSMQGLNIDPQHLQQRFASLDKPAGGYSLVGFKPYTVNAARRTREIGDEMYP